MTLTSQTVSERTFADFFDEAEPRLRRALTAGYGLDAGRSAAADALLYAWQHWDKLEGMNNPVGYLFRVGQSIARRGSERRSGWMTNEPRSIPWVEPGLEPALRSLSERQRMVVALIHGFGMSFGETAELLGLSKSSVQTYERRAMRVLRHRLGVTW